MKPNKCEECEVFKFDNKGNCWCGVKKKLTAKRTDKKQLTLMRTKCPIDWEEENED